MLNLKCKKEYAGDVGQYGIDFIFGKTYNANKVNNDCYYITTESGSDVEMTQTEVKEHFYI